VWRGVIWACVTVARPGDGPQGGQRTWDAARTFAHHLEHGAERALGDGLLHGEVMHGHARLPGSLHVHRRSRCDVYKSCTDHESGFLTHDECPWTRRDNLVELQLLSNCTSEPHCAPPHSSLGSCTTFREDALSSGFPAAPRAPAGNEAQRITSRPHRLLVLFNKELYIRRVSRVVGVWKGFPLLTLPTYEWRRGPHGAGAMRSRGVGGVTQQHGGGTVSIHERVRPRHGRPCAWRLCGAHAWAGALCAHTHARLTSSGLCVHQLYNTCSGGEVRPS
jgi:hypothetical protein